MVDCKNRIIEEAAIMFRTYGIRAVTMDMIASNLGMSKRTIYENFRDKEDLLINVMRCMEDHRKRLVEDTLQTSSDVIDAVFKLLKITSEHFREMSPAFFIDIKKYHHTIFKDGMGGTPDLSGSLKIVERGVADGIFIVNRGMFGIFRLTGDFDLFPLGEFSRQAIVSNLYVNYLRGISTSKGNELINKQLHALEINF